MTEIEPREVGVTSVLGLGNGWELGSIMITSHCETCIGVWVYKLMALVDKRMQQKYKLMKIPLIRCYGCTVGPDGQLSLGCDSS